MKKIVSLRSIVLVIVMVIFVLGINSDLVGISLLACLLLIGNNIQYTLKSIKEDVLFFCFNINFFIFLVGRMVVSGFFSYRIEERGIFGLDFTNIELTKTTLICIFISLLSLFFGYATIPKMRAKFFKKNNNQIVNSSFYVTFKKIQLRFFQRKDTPFITYLKISSLVLFYISIIFRLLIVWEMRQASVSEGYFNTFTTFQSHLPGMIQLVGNMYDMFFFSYLATLPRKRQAIFPIGLYLLEGTIAALGGRRSILMLNVLIVFVYFFVREGKEKNSWITIKEKILGVLSLPVLVLMMTIIGQLRSNFTDSIAEKGFFKNLLDPFFEFLYSQGVSANLIGYTELLGHRLPKPRIWTFGPVMEFLQNSIIRPFQGLPALTGQSVERAKQGFLYSQALPYLIMPLDYVKGYGYGSSFVAENFADLGYFGVFIGSVFYGLILIFLTKSLINGNFLFMTFGLSMARSILFAPRAAYLSFIVSTFSPMKIVAVLIVCLLAFCLKVLDEKTDRISLIK